MKNDTQTFFQIAFRYIISVNKAILSVKPMAMKTKPHSAPSAGMITRRKALTLSTTLSFALRGLASASCPPSVIIASGMDGAPMTSSACAKNRSGGGERPPATSTLSSPLSSAAYNKFRSNGHCG